jgi:hypothetical protein
VTVTWVTPPGTTNVCALPVYENVWVHVPPETHCPHASHVWAPPVPHCTAPGVHTGVAGLHEQSPHAHCALHVCDPYVLHACVVLGAHGPCPEQVPLVCHVPAGPHVCVSVPQLPHATGLVCPGAHVPTHVPPTHVWFAHAMGAPQWPVPSHVSTPLPEHSVAPAMGHAPEHCPAVHAPLLHGDGALHAVHPSVPSAHVWTPVPSHCVAPAVHAPVHGAASGPAAPSGTTCASGMAGPSVAGAESCVAPASRPASPPPSVAVAAPPHAYSATATTPASNDASGNPTRLPLVIARP